MINEVPKDRVVYGAYYSATLTLTSRSVIGKVESCYCCFVNRYPLCIIGLQALINVCITGFPSRFESL